MTTRIEEFDDTPSAFEIKICEMTSAVCHRDKSPYEANKVLFKGHAKALTKAHQAGIDEVVEKMEREIDGKLETWAALEHSRWSKWQEYLHSKLYEIDDNRVSANNHLKILPTELWQRWERQIMTAYSDLSEAEKESDREQVRPYIEDLKRTIKALQDR